MAIKSRGGAQSSSISNVGEMKPRQAVAPSPSKAPRAVVTNRRKLVRLHWTAVQWMGDLLKTEGRRGGPGQNEKLQAAS